MLPPERRTVDHHTGSGPFRILAHAPGDPTITHGMWATTPAGPLPRHRDGVIGAPSGRVTTRVHREDNRTVAVAFVNGRSRVATHVPVPTSRVP